MLNKVRRYIHLVEDNGVDFPQYFLNYMKKVQDQDIDAEVRNQLKFGLLQTSHFDCMIEADYRKLVNEANAKFN
jgi:hypothetical protein